MLCFHKAKQEQKCSVKYCELLQYFRNNFTATIVKFAGISLFCMLYYMNVITVAFAALMEPMKPKIFAVFSTCRCHVQRQHIQLSLTLYRLFLGYNVGFIKHIHAIL